MRTIRTLFYGSALYHLALTRPAPPVLALRLPARWPGDAARGAALLAGRFSFAGDTVESAAPPWDAAPSEDWRTAIHGFSWLADLAAVASVEAVQAARDWTADWIHRFDLYDSFIWRPDIMGDRLFHWLEHLDLVRAGIERRGFGASFARQTRHLARAAEREGGGLGRLKALRGLVASCAALGGRRAVAAARGRFEREIAAQFFADGGHRARSPAAQLEALRYLIDAAAALTAAEEEAAPALEGAIERAALMLRFFRHGDGGFALFNGADQGDHALIDLALARAGALGRTPLTAPDSGFERLQGGGTVVLFDCGGPPREGFGRDAHAGTLSFEMSHGQTRVIVNCGAGAREPWRSALSATAAHSTAIVANTNSAELSSDAAPGTVTHQRAEHGGDLWCAATHDGYQANFGLTHGRQLFLAADGNDLRGEDSLTGRAGSGFIVRFHLHPAIEAALQPEGNAVQLRLSDGGRWRLRAEGAVLSLGESIYAGAGTPRKTQQILLDGHVGSNGARVRWAIRREE
jgi:uncharacterized heparinase superfamily protein